VAIFNLTLQNENTTRVAVYDPYQSKLFWKDNNEDIVISEVDEEIRSKIFPISPQNPGTKTISLKKIKVQMGFACNYTCTYCSQNNQRSFSTDTAKKTQDKVSGFLKKCQLGLTVVRMDLARGFIWNFGEGKLSCTGMRLKI
jgi:hypothetical protein